MKQMLSQWQKEALKNFPHLTKENFYRIALLYEGVNYNQTKSFPDLYTRIEATFSIKNISSIPLLLLLQPKSRWQIIDSGTGQQKVLLFENQFVDKVDSYEDSYCNLEDPEPFYFIVKEANGEVVLKLNPIQLCNFYKSNVDSPCRFCFRNDFISRYHNIKAVDLVKLIYREEGKNNFRQFQAIDELSITTGTYPSDKEYLAEIGLLVEEMRKIIPPKCRITVGSHELKNRFAFAELRKKGVTDCTIPLESLSDLVRREMMKNRKGIIPFVSILKTISEAVKVFGEDHVIIRLVAGLGDALDKEFIEKVKKITGTGNHLGPRWNIDIYMPFTHNLTALFEKRRPFGVNYLFDYCAIINQYVPKERFLRFKISP